MRFAHRRHVQPGIRMLSSPIQRLLVLNMLFLSLLMFLTFEATTNSGRVKAQNLNCTAVDNYVDLKYLAEHIEEFEGLFVTTNGTVRYYASIFMFEDFWLEAQKGARIPVVTKFAGLPEPHEGLLIEVSGKIEYCRLEGGFYFLNATSWKTVEASPTSTLPQTQPQPSITPPPENPQTAEPNSSKSESEQPQTREQTSPQQASSDLINSMKCVLMVSAAVAAVAIVSTRLLYKREKPEPSN